MFLLILVAILLVLIVLIFVSVPWAEKKVLFFPSKKKHWIPDIPHSSVYINTNDPSRIYNTPKESIKYGRDYIHGWHFYNFRGRQTILYCHGNSGNITHRSYIVDICQKFELNLFIFDYRGFGDSSGRPTKKNLKKDGEAAYKYLIKYAGVNPKKLIIWGESLGGFVAIWTASKYSCQALILLCTFSGLDDAITYYFDEGIRRSVAYGCTSLINLRYDTMLSRNYIRNVRCPVVIMHSKDDDIIPYTCSKILYNNIQHDHKKLITIKGKHSSPNISYEKFKQLFEFCHIRIPSHQTSTHINKMLKDMRTVAKRYHNFIDK